MVGVANRDQPPSTSAAEGAAQPRPTITLPPHSSADTFFGGGAPPFAFSPGPMTLVSSLFATDGSGSNNNSDDYRSFSHLLAGAPVQSPLPMFPIYGLLDSPSAFFSSPQGQLGMTHQQTLEQVTAQAEVTSNSTHQIMLPSKPDSVGNSHSEQRLQPPPPPPPSSSYSSVNVDKPNDDGYNWRKYGQKQVKGSEFPRSYYKCTHPKCPVKKKVERSLEGHVTAIIYKGEHNHQCPHPDKITKDSTIANANSNMQGNCDSSVSKMDSGTSDNDEVDDHETEVDGEPDAKRRNTEFRNTDPTSSHRAVTEPRIIVQTTSEVDLLDDGYRWRKYGQKVVKGNPYPRSYYKCTTPSCNVRKHVERASADPKAVITTYEGKHNHDVPAAKSNSHTLANNAASHQLKSQNVMLERHSFGSRGIEGNEPQQPVARLRLKEEQIT